MKKRIKCQICAIVHCISFMYVLGVVGGLEHDYIELGRGVIMVLVGLAVWALSAHIGGFTRGRLP